MTRRNRDPENILITADYSGNIERNSNLEESLASTAAMIADRIYVIDRTLQIVSDALLKAQPLLSGRIFIRFERSQEVSYMEGGRKQSERYFDVAPYAYKAIRMYEAGWKPKKIDHSLFDLHEKVDEYYSYISTGRAFPVDIKSKNARLKKYRNLSNLANNIASANKKIIIKLLREADQLIVARSALVLLVKRWRQPIGNVVMSFLKEAHQTRGRVVKLQHRVKGDWHNDAINEFKKVKTKSRINQEQKKARLETEKIIREAKLRKGITA